MDAWRQARISLFIFYVLAASFGAGFTQRDLYPFAAWNLLPRWLGPTWMAVRLVGVDADGVEHAIDARSWEPLSGDELRTWFQLEFLQLGPAARDRAAAFLLDHVEATRRAAAANRRVGRYDRFLGPLAAPLTLLHPRPWQPRDSIPPQFVGLRYYRDRWGMERRAREPTAVSRRLLYEYRRR